MRPGSSIAKQDRLFSGVVDAMHADCDKLSCGLMTRLVL